MRTALKRTLLTIAAFMMLASAERAAAQSVELGGRAYVDYFYTLSSADEEGFHGFTYRRLYLTTDFTLSDDFKGRARLEADDGVAGPKGPAPFVKDLWLTWNYAGAHSATIGVTPTPIWGITEDVWGYRSLEKTITDFQGIASSRDLGLRLNGPLGAGGKLRYALMAGNNSGINRETDSYKRGYGQVEFYPTDELVFTAGADYAGYGDARESSTRVSGLGGYVAGRLAAGVEVYWFTTTFDVGDDLRSLGASLFGRIDVSTAWELVGRFDAVAEGFGDADRNENFVLLGAAYKPNDSVRIIPNLWLFATDENDEAEALGRMTVEVNF